MRGTRFRKVFRESAGNIWREFKISWTSTPKDKKWVFIVGCYNSGTTLLSEMLGSHPDISALATEGHFITDQFVKDYEIGLPRMWVEREDLFRLDEKNKGPDPIRVKKEWMMRLNLKKSVLVEKSPPNSARTRWLQHHFENAHFVCVIRNPYAVVEGIRRKANPPSISGNWPIEKCAYQWLRNQQVLEEDAPYLKRILWVKYEDFSNSPGEAINTIAEFCGLSPAHNAGDDMQFSIHERNQKVKNLNLESISRLSGAEIAKINDIAGEMIIKLGYTLIESNSTT